MRNTRYVGLTRLGALFTALALASPVAALPTLEISSIGGGQYLILLTIDADGLASLEWNVTSESGVPDTSASLALGFSVPSSDPVCGVAVGFCIFNATGPFVNASNPTGLNGYAVFVTNPAQALTGAPMDQPFTVGILTFSNAGSEGIVSAACDAAVLGDGVTTANTCNVIPEPATPSLLALALLGLGLVAHRSRGGDRFSLPGKSLPRT